ncbi:AzlD domain-containing protein [Nisaea acidiphila]|uniref:AzlD domain-containing protein n=1 Tax=Nisaea acidiphila TaxID=1862145 RepID=A0A9J7AMS1_9PROT|nr:AzlD domain-containing protein [Nisaea acidiphila]UUX48752.1 AzlD domain-containing protein [Nisaea acidiphila]
MTADLFALDMSFDTTALVAILLMGAVTYFTRLGGFLMMRWIPEGGFVSRWLQAIPGAVLVAILAPTVWNIGWLERAGLVVTLGLSALGSNALVAVLCGTAAVAVGRALF